MALFFTILLGCKGEAKKETKVNTTKEVLKKIGVQEINNDEGKLWKLVEYDSLGIQINNYIEYTEEGELKKYYYLRLYQVLSGIFIIKKNLSIQIIL